jgi:hypothetical protein
MATKVNIHLLKKGFLCILKAHIEIHNGSNLVIKRSEKFTFCFLEFLCTILPLIF